MARIGLRSGQWITAAPGETLLQSLLRAGLQPEFQCRQGYCGACRLPLLAGKLHYRQPPLAWLAADECLPCCGEARGEVLLNIDADNGEQRRAKSGSELSTATGG